MSTDRLTPKQIKAWCWKEFDKLNVTNNTYEYLLPDEVILLMYKSYKRGYQDALGG